jgi:hypothetical protein
METGVQRFSLHCTINRLSEYSMYQKEISLNAEHVDASNFFREVLGWNLAQNIDYHDSGFVVVFLRVSFCSGVQTDLGTQKGRLISFCEFTRH